MSLYRTYRPLSFADVVGQEHVVTTLENAAKNDKLAHAYLFAGSRGTGKTSVARILSKILMIRGIQDDAIQKQIITGVEDGSLVDLLEIDGASNRGIDDVRELIEKIQFSPVVAGAKVYIIDEVHMLTKEAFNALLKTLEEPPAYAYFILATTELNKVPTTIQSRCQCFPFHRIREEDIIRRLQYIADQEKIVIDREALRSIAHHVEGGMRDAISLLDQLQSLEKITVADIEQRIGATSGEHIEAVFGAIEQGDKKAIIDVVADVEEAGITLDVFLREMLSIVRRFLHEAVEKKESTAVYIDIMETLLQTIRDVRISPLPGLVVEAALLSLCSKDEQKADNASIFKKPEKKKETEVSEGTKGTDDTSVPSKTSVPSVTSSPKEASEETPVEPSAALVEATDLSLESVRGIWSEIVQQTNPPSVRMSLKDGEVAEVTEKKIVVRFASAFHKTKVEETEASRAVEAIMEKIFKRSLHLECTLGDGNGSSAGEPEVNLAEAAAEVF